MKSEPLTNMKSGISIRITLTLAMLLGGLALGFPPGAVALSGGYVCNIIPFLAADGYTLPQPANSPAVAYGIVYTYAPEPSPVPASGYCYVDLEEAGIPYANGVCTNGNSTSGSVNYYLVPLGGQPVSYGFGLIAAQGLVITNPCPKCFYAPITYIQMEHVIAITTINGVTTETTTLIPLNTVTITAGSPCVAEDRLPVGPFPGGAEQTST